jgi:hypothetical protein
MLDAWLHIGPDGKVTIFTGKVELGQGVLTALAQIAAEDWMPSRHPHGFGQYGLDEGYTSAANRSNTAARRFASPAPGSCNPDRKASVMLSAPKDRLRLRMALLQRPTAGS